MATLRKDLLVQQPFPVKKYYVCVPKSFDETLAIATTIAKSSICPEAFRGKPNDVFVIMQTGAEVGLSTFQALRCIGVINGVPFVYGVGLLTLVQRNPDFKDMKEWLSGSIAEENLTAHCTMWREGREPVTKSFGMKDAKLANLWGKTSKQGRASTWVTMPDLMLAYRARKRVIDSLFPEATFGILLEDEAKMIVETSVVEAPKTTKKGMAGLEETLDIAQEEIVEAEFVECKDDEAKPIVNAKVEELSLLFARLNVTKASITINLKKLNAESIDQLTDEQLDKWINHLKSKESK